MATQDHRGPAQLLKYAIAKHARNSFGEGLFRAFTVAYNKTISLLPYSIKYGIGTALRRKKYPYALLQPNDFVVQMGAPHDTLHAGRARAVHFARIVHQGKTLVIEPDPANCAQLKPFIDKNGLNDQVRLIEMGAWDKAGTLEFLSSDSHPAANLLADAKGISDEEMKRRGYKKISVPVDTFENLLAKGGITGLPKLISITTNGAEPQILDGMKNWLARNEVPYIALALTGKDYPERMAAMGYELMAIDDRGFTFRRKKVS